MFGRKRPHLARLRYAYADRMPILASQTLSGYRVAQANEKKNRAPRKKKQHSYDINKMSREYIVFVGSRL